jgi:hypothetical protein
MFRSANMQLVTVLLLVSSASLAHQRPAIIAQSSSAFEHARVSVTSVHHYVAADTVPRALTAPPNLLVPPMYGPLIESMLRESPTFRRQCVRIAGEPRLTVRLAIGSAPSRSGIRAATRMTRTKKGRLTALIDIGLFENVEELIAHEFEHIIEQLDGVDLAAQAAQRATGVTEIGHGRDVFETMRAKRTGLKVVSELGL